MTKKSTFTEPDLIALLRANNQNAFEYLYDSYSSALYGIILKIVRDEDKAADIMQDAYLKIWKNMSRYNPEKGSLFTWILNVAKNTAIDRLRIDSREEMSVSLDNVREIDLTPNIIYNPTQSTIDVREFVERLLPERKLLIDLVYFQGYTQEEVSEKLSMPLGTVKSRIRKSLKELRIVFDVHQPIRQVA